MLFLITTRVYSQNPCPGVPTVSYEGQTYNTVKIGTQCWFKENLNVGTGIHITVVSSDNGLIEKHCYNNYLNKEIKVHE